MPTRGDVPGHLLAGARTGFLQTIREQTENAPWTLVGMMNRMDGASTDLVDLGAAPMPTENRTGVTVQDFIEKQITVTPRDWDITVYVTYNAVQDDRTGALLQKVRGAGTNFNRHLNQLVFEALNGGDGSTVAGLCYDGGNFFSNSHVDPGASYTTAQDNMFDLALSSDNFETVNVAAALYRDDQGELTGNRGNLLVVPPAYEREAAQLAGAMELHDGSNREMNPWRQNLTYIVSPYLDATSWFLVDTNQATKPIIVNMRQDPFLQEAWFDPEKPDGGHYYFKYYARYSVNYGDWRLATMGDS